MLQAPGGRGTQSERVGEWVSGWEWLAIELSVATYCMARISRSAARAAPFLEGLGILTATAAPERCPTNTSAKTPSLILCETATWPVRSGGVSMVGDDGRYGFAGGMLDAGVGVCLLLLDTRE